MFRKTSFVTICVMKGDFFMARHSVEICGVNTANIKVLSHDEMMDLFKKMKEGDN